MEANSENYHAYNRNLQHFANALRHRMTKAEACLWKYALRAGIRQGYSFRRQRPVLNFIADFMCKELMLVIEVDGYIHDLPENVVKDRIRDEKLKAGGFEILRFKNEEVLERMSWVINEIDLKISDIEINSKVKPKKRGPRRGKRPPP